MSWAPTMGAGRQNHFSPHIVLKQPGKFGPFNRIKQLYTEAFSLHFVLSVPYLIITFTKKLVSLPLMLGAHAGFH